MKRKVSSPGHKTPTGSSTSDPVADFFGRIIDALPDPLFVKDEQHRWVALNKPFCSLVGHPFDGLIGRSDHDFFPKEEADVFYTKDSEVFESGKMVENEENITNSAGEQHVICTRKSIFTDNEGKKFLVGTIRDVTVQTQIESELRESERRFHSAFKYAPIGIALISPEGRFIKVNNALASIVGYSVDELVERTFQQITHPADLDQDLAYMTQLLSRKIESYKVEKRYIHRAGHEVWALLSVSMINDQDGKPLYFIAQIQDISDQKQSIAALQEARGAAEEASRAKSEFLANMSHEIRTPLNAVLGMTDLLLNTKVSETERQEYLQTIYSSGQSLLSILNDILDFSKIEARKLQLVVTQFSIEKLVKEIAALFALSAQQKDIQFSVSLSETVPKHLIGDPHRLRQVLVNLVGNALKFTEPEGSVALGLELLGSSKEEASVRFTVVDTGIGIPEERLPELFQEFHQLDNSPTRQHGGTGLGLAISSRLVELMGGKLTVASQPGKGSTFSFATSFNLTGAPSAERVPSMSLAQPIMPARILVAEDNRFNQLLLRSILEKSGHIVTLAANGSELLRCSEEESFDIILMDVQMPGIDGYEAIRLLRAQEAQKGVRSIPVVAITAHAVEGHKERCLQAGMNDFVTKPIDRQNLLMKVSMLVSEHRR